MSRASRLSASTRAFSFAITTMDAYTFPTYGAPAWQACCALLFHRGYNRAEVTAILYSKLMRLAADGRRHADRHATSRDLTRFLDSFRADDLQGHVDAYVVGIHAADRIGEADARSGAPARGTLRLVWSRPMPAVEGTV